MARLIDVACAAIATDRGDLAANSLRRRLQLDKLDRCIADQRGGFWSPELRGAVRGVIAEVPACAAAAKRDGKNAKNHQFAGNIG